MDNAKKFLKFLQKMDADTSLLYSSYGLFALSCVYIFYHSQIATILLSIGVALVLYSVTNFNIPIALIAGSLAGLITLHYSRNVERFANPEDDTEEAFNTEKTEKAEKAEKPKLPNETEGFEHDGSDDEDSDDEDMMEGFANVPKAKKGRKGKAGKAGKAGKTGKAPPPDNGDRAEFLQLGKKYKVPSEDDDKEFHLDAGTTFMNAYKSLKPDQIAAMTKDTQDLMSTQKQLMSTLQTLKPLIKDGKDMMDMFQGYFGAGAASLN